MVNRFYLNLESFEILFSSVFGKPKKKKLILFSPLFLQFNKAHVSATTWNLNLNHTLG